MPNLVDLAYTPKEQKEREDKYSAMPSAYDGPKYPWGLELTLDDSVLRKLGKSSRDFRIGDEIDLPVRVRVTRISAYETESGSDESVGLTVTHMQGEGEDRAAKLYPMQGKDDAR